MFRLKYALRKMATDQMPKVAICISGHLRTTDMTTIVSNLCEVLEGMGIECHYFVSTWNSIQQRVNADLINVGYADVNTIVQKLSPKSVLVEEADRDLFVSTYCTDKHKEIAHLCNHTSSGDAVSMHYQIYNAYALAVKYQELHKFEYDAFVRLRPDIIIHKPIPTNVITDALENNVVYIPEWSGKFIECSGTITDYFAIGNKLAMKRYMTVFPNINHILSNNRFPHTGEGMLWCNLISDHINHPIPIINRLENIPFSVRRDTGTFSLTN